MDGFGASWRQSDRMHGLLFDGGMLLVSFWLLRTLMATHVEAYDDREIGLLLAVGLLAHFLGALLKKEPLQARLESRKLGGQERENLLGCLSFIHFIFLLVVVVMAMALIGFFDVDELQGVQESLWFGLSFVVAGIITGTVWLAIRNPVAGREPVIWWAYQEFAADLLLVVSTTILTRFFWTALFLESEPPNYMGFSQRSIVYVTAVSVLFMVFYVPSRLLFLAEDYRYPSTWLRLWFVAMFPLLMVVFIP